jgi:hypothetical protein
VSRVTPRLKPFRDLHYGPNPLTSDATRAAMKFNDGYWLLREGVTARYATEALDTRTTGDRASVA